MSAKPEAVLRHFFRMFVGPTTYMLDPTCGSGTALRAAHFRGASYMVGVEKDEEFADKARLWLGRAQRTQSAEIVLGEILGT